MFEGFRIVKYDDMLTARTLQILGGLSLSSVLSFPRRGRPQHRPSHHPVHGQVKVPPGIPEVTDFILEVQKENIRVEFYTKETHNFNFLLLFPL